MTGQCRLFMLWRFNQLQKRVLMPGHLGFGCIEVHRMQHSMHLFAFTTQNQPHGFWKEILKDVLTIYHMNG
jgi:hypothetical protein